MHIIKKKGIQSLLRKPEKEDALGRLGGDYVKVSVGKKSDSRIGNFLFSLH
jgi:hypothetical protein